MQLLPSIPKLPAPMNREIGRIIVGFAFFEYTLTRIAYDLLSINPKQGRTAVRGPRGNELVEMVQDLCNLANLKLHFNWKSLISRAKYINSRRDLLAHGVWLRDKNTNNYLLLRTRGQWTPEPHKSGRLKRAISPQGEQHALEDLISIYSEIEVLFEACDELKSKVEIGLESLQKKPPPQSPQKSRSRNPSRTKRKPSQKSSAG